MRDVDIAMDTYSPLLSCTALLLLYDILKHLKIKTDPGPDPDPGSDPDPDPRF